MGESVRSAGPGISGGAEPSQKADGGKVHPTGVYHYDGVLFVIDDTVKPGDSVLPEAGDAK